MKIQSFVGLLLCSFSVLACAQAGTGKALQDEPSFAKMKVVDSLGIIGYEDEKGNSRVSLRLYENTLPKISQVKVNQRFTFTRVENTIQNLSEKDECDARATRPNEKDVKEFFSLAGEVDKTQALQILINPQCKAYGTISFEDGSTGNWNISPYGQGWLTFPDGRQQVFYCARCSNLFTLEDLDEKTLKKYGRAPDAGDTFKE